MNLPIVHLSRAGVGRKHCVPGGGALEKGSHNGRRGEKAEKGGTRGHVRSGQYQYEILVARKLSQWKLENETVFDGLETLQKGFRRDAMSTTLF